MKSVGRLPHEVRKKEAEDYAVEFKAGGCCFWSGFPEFPSWLVRTYACFQAFVTYHEAYLKPIRSHLPMDFKWIL